MDDGLAPPPRRVRDRLTGDRSGSAPPTTVVAVPECVCGAVNDDRARFCSTCGRPMSEADQQGALIDPGAREVSTAEVRREGVGRRGWVPLVVVALVIAGALAIWGSARGPSPERAGDDTVPPPDTTEPDRSTTTAEPADRTPRLTAGDAVGPPDGYDVVVATTGRPALVDLDTGEAAYHDGDRVFPVLVSGPWLIVEDMANGRVARLALDDLGGDTEPLIDLEDAAFTDVTGPPIVSDPGSGRLWVNVVRQGPANEFASSLYLIDIDTGDILEEQAFDGGFLRTVGSWPAGGFGDLVNGPAGGVYEAVEDGYRQVADGRLITADGTRALVQTCDESMTCVATWLDRGSWQALDLAVPSSLEGNLVVVPGTDWLFRLPWDESRGPGSAELLSLESGQIIPLDAVNYRFNNSLGFPAISADGTLLVQHTDDPRRLEVRDLETGDRSSVELDEAATGPILFLDR